jgi:hypothetical protein
MQESTPNDPLLIESLAEIQHYLLRAVSRARLVLSGEFSFGDLTENPRHLDLSLPLELQQSEATVPDSSEIVEVGNRIFG